MSKSLDVMSETNFNKLIHEYNTNELLNNPINLIEKYSEYYTNFSGNLNRLYDVVYDGEEIKNDFSKEIDLHIIKLSKEHIINIIENSYDDNLIEKWEFIMQVFEDYDIKTAIFYKYIKRGRGYYDNVKLCKTYISCSL